MNRKETLVLASWFLGLAFIAGVGSADGQQAAPTETKGVTQKLLAAVDLGPEIEGMGGRQLRMRTVTIEPGGIFGIHSHKDRPGVNYVLQGKITEHRGDVTKEYGPGEFWTENKETTHWVENKGTTPAVFIPVDIFKQQ
jgi:quercetin dioxygenase-like cupin family protein